MTAPAELTLQDRLAAVREAAARDAHRSPAAARALLERRARQLARTSTDSADEDVDAIDLLLVQVGDERLGIPLATIVAIARAMRVVPLPRVVAPVYGVTAWRGRPLTVLSLAAQRVVLSADSRLVVLGTGARAALAVVVDSVHDIARAPRASLSPAGPGPRLRYALGVTPDGLLVVNSDVLLHPETLTT